MSKTKGLATRTRLLIVFARSVTAFHSGDLPRRAARIPLPSHIAFLISGPKAFLVTAERYSSGYVAMAEDRLWNVRADNPMAQAR